MSVQERLDELSPYVTAIRYGNIPIVETAFPKSWGVSEDKMIQVQPLDGDSTLVTKCLVFSEIDTVTIDEVLAYIEATIKMNQEREMKKALLKAKVEELKELFNSNSLSRLETLYFDFSKPTIKADELDLDLELEPAKPEEVEVPTPVEPEPTTHTTTDNVKVELPPRKPEAPKLEEFDTPTCKCGEGESCPECTDL